MHFLALSFALIANASAFVLPKRELEFESMLDRVLAAQAADPAAPGGVVAISRDGVIVAERGFGLANLDFDLPNAPDTVLDIGSTSKQFTAAAIVLLALEEALTLDDALRDHLPELPPVYSEITLRHLLHHTSGIRDYLPLLAFDGKPETDHTTCADALAAIARQRGLCFEPGSFHEYSNSGYFLLAQVVERVSGESFATFAAKRFFEPLGMRDTHVHDDTSAVVKRRATSYSPLPDGRFEQATSDYEQTGDGAVMTTVRDLLAWADNYRTGKVGGAEYRAAMEARGALDDGTSLAYGMGLMHDTIAGRERDVAVVSHGGAWVGYRADLWRVPNLGGNTWAVAVLMNRADGDPSAIARSIVETLVDEFAGPAASAPTEQPELDALDIEPEALMPWIGRYRCPNDESTLELATEAGRLALVSNGRRRVLVARESHLFGHRETGLELRITDSADMPPRLEVRSPAGRREYVRFDPWAPDAAALDPFAGRYVSEESTAVLGFALDANGRLVASISDDPIGALNPLALDVFVFPGGAFRFTRDADGKPSAVEIRMRGIAGMSFVRTAR